MDDTGTDGGATATYLTSVEQSADPAERELPEKKSIVEGFAGYRALRRRIGELERTGQSVPSFQPRDAASHSVIHRQGKSLINYSGYNYLGLSGHPAVSAAANTAIDKYGTSAA